jgi:zinc transporter ZupT
VSNEVFQVFIYALITALATGLGAIPFAFIKKITGKIMGISNAIAAGLMVGATFTLIDEGIEQDYLKTLFGMAIGLLFILGVEKILDGYEHKHQDSPSFLVNKHGFFKNFKKAIIIIVVMTAHSAAEGIGLGTSFGGNLKFGLMMTIAIAIHNIPEGLAISASLVGKGVSWWKACLWSIFTSLPQPLFAVPAFLFISYFKNYLPVGLGFAAGAMLWVVFSDIVPESQENLEEKKSATIISLFIIAMMLFQYLLE